jgi:acylphosphatase
MTQQRTIQFHVVVTGDVQDGAFRSFTRRQALALKLKGWVRNLPDGQVEAVFHGPEANVNAMVAWCRKGPLQAQVADVQAERMPLEAFLDFSVR